jgi:hypothetical protein
VETITRKRGIPIIAIAGIAAGPRDSFPRSTTCLGPDRLLPWETAQALGRTASLRAVSAFRISRVAGSRTRVAGREAARPAGASWTPWFARGIRWLQAIALGAIETPRILVIVSSVSSRCSVLPAVLPIRMAKRTKRSVSLPPELAVAIDRAAQDKGETFSGWLAATAVHRLRIEAGRRGLVEWERAHGGLTAAELDAGRARARALLGRSGADAPRRQRRTA